MKISEINQYDLGKKLYHDWKDVNDDAHDLIRKIGKNKINVEKLKKGFYDERNKFVQDDEDEECFYGAMDEVGTIFWKE